MNIEELREYCLLKKGVTESLPFNDTALVFKVIDKMFALLDISEENRGISLKCDPDLAPELREHYPEITPAYHFNKKHWNTIIIDSSIPDKLIKEWIDHSYDEVVKGLTKKDREELNRN